MLPSNLDVKAGQMKLLQVSGYSLSQPLSTVPLAGQDFTLHPHLEIGSLKHEGALRASRAPEQSRRWPAKSATFVSDNLYTSYVLSQTGRILS